LGLATQLGARGSARLNSWLDSTCGSWLGSARLDLDSQLRYGSACGLVRFGLDSRLGLALHRRLQDQRSTTVEASPAASWRTMKLYFNATDGQTKGDARRFWDEGDEGGGVDGRPTAAETTDSLAFVQSCRCRKVAACANDGGREETLKWTGEDGSAVG
uniref:Uncharacterized protein n=1 Tax=Cucumis melo TaxID=3656 RepID=A0A9I9E065_CUCME